MTSSTFWNDGRTWNEHGPGNPAYQLICLFLSISFRERASCIHLLTDSVDECFRVLMRLPEGGPAWLRDFQFYHEDGGADVVEIHATDDTDGWFPFSIGGLMRPGWGELTPFPLDMRSALVDELRWIARLSTQARDGYLIIHAARATWRPRMAIRDDEVMIWFGEAPCRFGGGRTPGMNRALD
ncbi:MAG: hypothetical protein KDA33_06965 [Phycisphaerales bacterium]|nr:hypothetical protein [Phycisphaerales bacterium]